MINRRRRASSASVASRQEEDIADDSTPEQSPVLTTSGGRKRRKPDPSELCQQLYDSIRNVKKEDGSMLCDTFIRAPKRRQEPSYYEVVANPIDLLRVQQKLKTESYEDIDELTSDIELLVKNAKAFYKPGSTEYQDAVILWETFLANKSKMFENADDEPRIKRVPRQPRRSTATENDSDKTDEDFDAFEELFAAVMTATDPLQENRALHREFQLLPSKKIYPDYYHVIEHPIDLKLIATKIQTSAYNSLGEMEKDLLQMTRNACTFNEPGSQIYKDAKTLKKMISARKAEIESGKVKTTVVKKRGPTLSALTAALKEEPESSDDEDDERSKKCGDGPLWQLFDHLFNAASASDHPNATGAPLGQALWKLPYRRFHPEYYELIKKPISMSQIQNKLKKGDYSNISDLTADLYLMLDNAKRAFPPSNRIHKDAVKMLKIMNAKLIDDENGSDTEDQDMSESSTCTTPSGQRKKVVANNSSPKVKTGNVSLRKRLLALQKYLTDYTFDGRKLMGLFMEKPSKKLYPDYYNVIQTPIDMATIENNIKNDRYSCLDELISDYRLMFANCRQYNEEGSAIFEDSNMMEQVLNEKLKEITTAKDIKMSQKTTKSKNRTPIETKLRILYETIRDYHEPKGNKQLSIIFMKLPSKNDYPDYYDIIKNPIDMEKISMKVKQQSYESVDELAADILLMLENACKYNEPDSQIYKDALVLQQLCMQTKQSLRDNDEPVPDVALAVQELLLSLFTLLYNHQDDEGRCYSDSLAELSEYDESDGGTRVRGISLDLIKRRLDKGLYKRLDIFQEDVFACLERARRLSRTDSQIFEDSIELQAFFIRKRDKLCKDILTSTALNYSTLHLSAAVEAVRQSKLLQEEQDQEDDTTTTQGESMTIDHKVYSPGDFVYFENPDNKIPGIAYIERLWTNNDNVQMMYGNIFFRPHETYHVATRKFLEQEVFKSDQHQAIPLSRVQSKCFVMNIKDYIKMRPEGFLDKDIYVCESRYNIRCRSFKKMKTWPFVREKDPVKLVPREKPIELKRIMSVFKERVEKHKGELAELQLQEAMVEKDKPNVVCYVTNGEEGNTYYEQYNTICSGVVKTGDYVYIATQTGKQTIAQIASIWEADEGKSYFQGPWLLSPSEISINTTKNFYRQELLLSTVPESNPIIAIVGKCAVLDYAEYTTCRPTEIPECDTYICDSTFDEVKKTIKKFSGGNGLRKFTHSQLVTPDEIFHFKQPIKPLREPKLVETSSEPIGILEDSLDGGGPPSVSSDVATTSSPAPSIASTPVSTKGGKSKSHKPKVITGYILFSSEMRKSISQSNPNASFGEISRMVGQDWKNLPTNVKQAWEDRAMKTNKEHAASILGIIDDNMCGSPTPDHVGQQLYECLWDKCDLQFEDSLDCMEHCIQDGNGHVQQHYANKTGTIEYHCMWRTCIRLRKNLGAFPHLQRLIKHVREVHLSKVGKVLLDKSKTLIHRKNPLPPATPNASAAASPGSSQQPSPQSGTSQSLIQAAQPPEPMFVTVPPRPQRVLHSEAYIKYIEGLQSNTSHIYPYEKTIRSVETTTPPTVDISKLPSQWLGKHAQDKPEEVMNALWHLRNFMLKDVLEINKKCF